VAVRWLVSPQSPTNMLHNAISLSILNPHLTRILLLLLPEKGIFYPSFLFIIIISLYFHALSYPSPNLLDKVELTS
jgi:hypothetical protein